MITIHFPFPIKKACDQEGDKHGDAKPGKPIASLRIKCFFARNVYLSGNRDEMVEHRCRFCQDATTIIAKR